jgi:fructose-1,6-bisphosphatase
MKFSVGSIFGIWPGNGLLGRTGREQVASVVSMYGPRTTLIIALPSKSRDADNRGDIVFEVTLVKDHTRWEVSRNDVVLEPSKKVFGKLRSDNRGGVGGACYHLNYSMSLQ